MDSTGLSLALHSGWPVPRQILGNMSKKGPWAQIIIIIKGAIVLVGSRIYKTATVGNLNIYPVVVLN